MRILHCLHNYYPARGGAEWLMQSVSERLLQRGNQLNVISTNAYSVEDYFLSGKGKKLMPAGLEDINGISVTRVPFSRKGAFCLNVARATANRIPLPFGDWMKMLSWGPRSRAYYRTILNLGKVDLIAACPLPTMNVWYAWKASKKMQIPLVIIPCYHTEDKWTFHNHLYFKMLREADAVITLTDWEKDYITREGHITEEKIYSLGVGIDIDISISPIDIRQKYGIREEEIVLFLGQQGKHKGIIQLIEAMKYVWREKQDVALIIAGNPTAHTTQIEKKINLLAENHQKKIYMIKGFAEEEKAGFLQSADIFVSVSPFESFGIVFLEAWAAKKPVIGCNRGGSSKLIDEFKDGLLVESEDPPQLAGAILELLENKQIRRKMGENGFNKVKAKYTWEKIMEEWEDLYHEVIQRKRDSQ